YISSLLPELILNYGSVLFFVAGFYFMFVRKVQRNRFFLPFLVWGISILFYFLFEINTITTVHDYYLFPFLPQIFLIVAYGAWQLLSAEKKILRVLTIVCLAILPATAFIRAYSRWDPTDPDYAAVFV